MKVVLSCIGKFHHFALARELHAAGILDSIYTGYPRWKLRGERLPADKIRTFPWLQTVYMARNKLRLNGAAFSRALGLLAGRFHDRWVARNLARCDVFIGLSGHNLLAGRRAKALGAVWICDRGSAHIQFQNRILCEEHSRWGIAWDGIPAEILGQEMVEYEEADAITVPSRFAERSFIAAGVSADKVRRVAYGVDLKQFHSVAKPDSAYFDVIFIGAVTVQKGVPYLIEAFRNLKRHEKRLTIIGAIDPALAPWVRQIKDSDIRFHGPQPQAHLREYLSRSHVFVLASVQEGMALVQAEALACGCPIVVTENTGGEDIIDDGVEGFVVPARNSNALTDALQRLADSPSLRDKMSNAALAKVESLGGWNTYGSKYIALVTELIAR
jgi:starch synthase